MLEENSSNDEKGQIMWQRSLPWPTAGCLVTAIVVGQPTSPTTPKNEKKPLVPRSSAVVALCSRNSAKSRPENGGEPDYRRYPLSKQCAGDVREVDVPSGKAYTRIHGFPASSDHRAQFAQYGKKPTSDSA